MMLETNGLTKWYGGRVGCADISLKVKEGQIFGLLGPNGAGKSTFVKMIVGLLRPTSGEASILGFPIGSVEARRHIGYLPELFRYQDWLQAGEVLAFHSRLSGRSAREVRSAPMAEHIRSVLQEVGLAGREHERVKHFSKGMQQRLGLACALLTDPSFIILDEPCSALDPVGRHEVRMILEKLRMRGKTVLLNTHLLEDVQALCDEVAFIYRGELKAVGTLESVLQSDARWQIAVGGWDASMLERVGSEPLQGIQLRELALEADGTALLEVAAGNRELLGWVNARLIEAGAVLYEVKPVRSSLEDWFLDMAQEKRGEAK